MLFPFEFRHISILCGVGNVSAWLEKFISDAGLDQFAFARLTAYGASDRSISITITLAFQTYICDQTLPSKELKAHQACDLCQPLTVAFIRIVSRRTPTRSAQELTLIGF
jgi:hypothetical protein